MKCDYCNLEVNGQYYIDSWGHNFHCEHLSEAKVCGSCGSIVIPTSTPRPVRLVDGRSICGNCSTDAIQNVWQMNRCINAVYEFYKRAKISFPQQKIKFTLVNENDIAKNALGFTSSIGNKYTVKLLLGLNKTIMCSVITHELMHIHLHQIDVVDLLTKQENEGVCEVASFFSLKMFSSKHADTQIKRMEANTDNIYGDGFRIMRDRIKSFGSIQNYLQTLKM